jgi:hypothetical protein
MVLNRMPLESSDVTAQTLRMHHDPQRDTPEAIEIVPATRAAQPDLIDAYWDDVEERVHYLMSLLGAGRHNEALALCAVYLEGVAHALVCSNAPDAESFADEAEEHASDPYLSLVHPLQLVCVAAQLNGLSPSAVHGLHATFPGPEHTLLRKGQAVAIVRANLAHTDAAVVERALWKCTVAYVIYDFINTQSFRRREGANTIGLGTAFREGNAAQGLSVPELVALLCSMIAEARARSHASGTLPA